MSDVIALRAHLVAEAEQAKRQARYMQIRSAWHAKSPRTSSAQFYATSARTATDAWLAADARLRALDGLLEAAKAQADAVELRRTGTYARGRWYTREEIAALMLAPCEGDACDSVRYFSRECLPCGLRRLGVAVRP